MEKPKDIVIEEGKAMLLGFIIALLICGFLFWAFNVKAQIVDSYIKTTQITDSLGTHTIQIIPDDKTISISEAIAYKNDLLSQLKEKDIILSKYAKLYDSCKNK